MNRSKIIWTIVRAFVFLYLGILAIVWAQTGKLDNWCLYLGLVFLVFAIIDIVVLVRYYINKKKKD